MKIAVKRFLIMVLVGIRKKITDATSDILYFFHGVVVFYNYPKKLTYFPVVNKVRHEREALFDLPEGYNIYCAVMATGKVRGDIAEVGVFKGASSKIICIAKGKRTLHLFDTFSGLPEPTRNDHAVHYKGMFYSSFDDVKRYLRQYKGKFFYRGYFPDTAKPIVHKHFSFVHLDVDLYKSTLDCLKFFYPRMSKGGIILSHDYSALPGVKKAFDEFFADKPEPVIPLIGSQCFVMKL